ncbi:hypothetical protein [Vreelandella titanicae]|uniref:hypothetical protein n=1 Tax=Vreelandella titanicae TaxID=664683 RepID=UPI00241F8F93|nr:hypothetical protein [Halomonas titanicae]
MRWLGSLGVALAFRLEVELALVLWEERELAAATYVKRGGGGVFLGALTLERWLDLADLVRAADLAGVVDLFHIERDGDFAGLAGGDDASSHSAERLADFVAEDAGV